MDHIREGGETFDYPGQLIDIIDCHCYKHVGCTGATVSCRRHGLDTETFVGQYVGYVTYQAPAVIGADRKLHRRITAVGLGPFDAQHPVWPGGPHPDQARTVTAMNGYSATHRDITSDRLRP